MKIYTVSFSLNCDNNDGRYSYLPVIKDIQEGVEAYILKKHINISQTIKNGLVKEGTLGIRRVNRTRERRPILSCFLPARFCDFYEYIHLSPEPSLGQEEVLVYLYQLNSFDEPMPEYNDPYMCGLSTLYAVNDSQCILNSSRFHQYINYPKRHVGPHALLYFRSVDNVVEYRFGNCYRLYFGYANGQFHFRSFDPNIDYSQLSNLEEYLLAEEDSEFSQIQLTNQKECQEIKDHYLLLAEQKDFTPF